MRRLLLFLLFVAALAHAQPRILLPRTGLMADDLGLIINDDDPLSRRVGDYYRKARGIPERNVVRVRFPPERSTLPADEFTALRERIVRATPAHVQAWAVAWTQPYRAGCMSITSALAFGFDPAYCSDSCGTTRPSPYFDSPSRYPALDHGLRPAMLLAGTDFEQVKHLIDRGLAADGTFPGGTAYLLSTDDSARNIRAAYFDKTAALLAGALPVEVMAGNTLSNRDDVLFYFTGLAQVPDLGTLRFLPGALGDHLTSFGGQLTESRQMSALRWLEAGATASYGTVVEPCNHPQKFPFPAIAMLHYARGESAIEAYWKSVAWPGEGVFIGEPLARPFAPRLRETAPGRYELTLFVADNARLFLEHADSPMGPFRRLPKHIPLHRGINRVRFELPAGMNGYFRLIW